MFHSCGRIQNGTSNSWAWQINFFFCSWQLSVANATMTTIRLFLSCSHLCCFIFVQWLFCSWIFGPANWLAETDFNSWKIRISWRKSCLLLFHVQCIVMIWTEEESSTCKVQLARLVTKLAAQVIKLIYKLQLLLVQLNFH